MPGWRHPVSENALIVGTDDDGNSVDAKCDLEEICSQVNFHPDDEMETWRKKVLDTPFTVTSF